MEELWATSDRTLVQVSIDIPMDPATFHLLDASGQEVAYELDWDATNEIQGTHVLGQTMKRY